MQNDSLQFVSSSRLKQVNNQADTPEKSHQCSQCTLIFRSKVYLFEHLNKVHDFDTDAALRGAGLKYAGSNKANNNSGGSGSGDHLKCQHCDFKASGQDVLKDHVKLCPVRSVNSSPTGTRLIFENANTKVVVVSTNQQSDAAGAKESPSDVSLVSTSGTKCTPISSKDLKVYKKPLQTITKYFTAATGSKAKSPAKLADSTEGTLLLKESPASSSSDSSGVFKVTAKSMIDIPKSVPYCSLQSDPLWKPDLTPPKLVEQFQQRVLNKVCKRPDDESLGSPPAKKVKPCIEGTKLPENHNTGTRQPSSPGFSFDVSEDEEEKKGHLVNGETKSPEVYRCKHCDYSDASITHVSAHYQKDHPYVRYNSLYIQDPKNQSATFRCLECPVDFVSTAALKKHYMEKHPEASNVFSMKSCPLTLVFRCFVCPFTTKVLESLKKHYKEKHPTHKVGNSLLYCRYSVSTFEKTPSPERSGGMSAESTGNETSPQHPSSTGPGRLLYKCNSCKFSHKSVIVMHVHYRKNHPDEAITIDKIKQLACVTPISASQVTPEKSPKPVAVKENSTPPKSISDSTRKTKVKAELSPQKKISLISPELLPGTSQKSSESPKTKKVDSVEDRNETIRSPGKRDRELTAGTDSSPNVTFYCQFCSFTGTTVRSVAGHHNAKHSKDVPASFEDILLYSVEVEKEKLKSEAKTSKRTSHSKTIQQVEACSETASYEEDNEADASVEEFGAYACAENLFYCPRCNCGNPTLKGILDHQNKRHRHFKSSSEGIIKHTISIRDEIKKSKSCPKKFPSSTHLPLPFMNEGDEDMFFCHLCNNRHSAVDLVLKHYQKIHQGVRVTAALILQHTSVVLEQTRKPHLKSTVDQEVNEESVGKTEKLARSLTVSSTLSSNTSQTQRVLQCYRCPYKTPNVYPLKLHLWKVHRSKRSVTAVLKACFNQGALRSGYHCGFCVFTHKKAVELYKHYRKHHPERKISLEFVSTQLYVGPRTFPSRKKKKLKPTDDIGDGDGDGDGDGSSHFLNSQKADVNSQVEDFSEMTESFDSYQVPLESDRSPHEAAGSPTEFKCSSCPASFLSQHGLIIHCGMKHHKAENPEEQQKQIQTRLHVFKCRYCTYVNTIYQGVTTHSQMKHPSHMSRVDSFYVDKTHIQNWDDSSKKNSPGEILKFSGYMCKSCPHICATLDKLNKHCERDHSKTAASTALSTLKPPPKPSVSKTQQAKVHSTQASVLKASFFAKKNNAMIGCQQCSYKCTTKIALSRHLLTHHKNAVSKESLYKCILCSKPYFNKKCLGSHYFKKHGKDAYLKYFLSAYKQVPEKTAPTSPDHLLTEQPQNTSESHLENTVVVVKCPRCPYVNATFYGILTHCQMKHPHYVARADQLQTCEIILSDVVKCSMGKGSTTRGYMCKKCPQIHASLKKLNVHCKDHNNSADSEHSAETEPADHPQASASASLTNQTTHVSSGVLYKCTLCIYVGFNRRNLYCHYRQTHRLDAISIVKLLEKDYKLKGGKDKKVNKLPDSAECGQSTNLKCKTCPDLTFDSFQLLIDHYAVFHRSDYKLDFTVLSLGVKQKSTGTYKCVQCKKQLNGIRKLCRHLDRHAAVQKEMVKAAKRKTLLATTSEPKSVQLYRQHELPTMESVEELTQSNAVPAETTQITDTARAEDGLEKEKHFCKQCGRNFMSLKGLRSHERSHAAVAAIKKLDLLPASTLEFDLKEYVLYKPGHMRPFVCVLCSYRTTVFGLCKRHFMKKHKDVIVESVKPYVKVEESDPKAEEERSSSSDLPELDEDPEPFEDSVYLEPPDVRRQLNHYSLMAQSGNKFEALKLPENSMLHCEMCDFHTEHLSSIRRHYLNRHGKRMLRCKDCEFFTGLRKTLEMHIETGHSTFQSQPTHLKDLRCPFCLYQTKNKNNMIDHIVLHREERVVPIEVRRPKLSRYLRDVVFRCHKCTFTSGSVQNLRSHMMRHDDVKPYKCRLCYFDCPRLSDLEAHLSDKHQVVRNHELVGQVSLDQLEERSGSAPENEEDLSNLEQHNSDSEDLESEAFVTDSEDVPHVAENNITEKITAQIEEGHQANTPDICWTEKEIRPKLFDSEDNGSTFAQQHGEKSAEESSATSIIKADKTQTPKLQANSLEQRTLNLKALRHILLLGKDGGTSRVNKREDQERTVKIEQNGEAPSPGNEDGVSSAEKPKSQSHTPTLSAYANISSARANTARAPETVSPSSAQLNVSHKDSLGVSFVNCKQEQAAGKKKNCEEEPEPFREMPVLENEYLKEEMPLLRCCKEEERNADGLEQKREKDQEVIVEDDEKQSSDRDSLHGHKDGLAAAQEAADVPSFSPKQEKRYTCEFCGRTLVNSSELKRHVMRHGL